MQPHRHQATSHLVGDAAAGEPSWGTGLPAGGQMDKAIPGQPVLQETIQETSTSIVKFVGNIF